METFWSFMLRGVGIIFALMLGVLIIWKSRRWKDPALYWLLAGLAIGPIIILSWNLFYQLALSKTLTPYSRIDFVPFSNIEFRYIYLIVNEVMDFLCVLAVCLGIAKLYHKAQERVRLVPPEKATTNDPRN